MVNYELYNINGLTPLKIQRIRDRNELEKNANVKSLIESKLLLNKDLNILLNNLINISDRVLSFIKYLNKKPQELFEKVKGGKISDKDLSYFQFMFSNLYKGSLFTRKKLKIDDVINFNNLKIDEITKLSNKIQDEINKFEKKYEKKLEIVEHITLYVCSDCKNILSLDKFKRGKCTTCKKNIGSSAKTEQISVAILSRSVKKFFNNNWWLEEGVSYLLKRQNLEVKTGLYILGCSGVYHEIDVLGNKKEGHMRLLCECKNTVINSSDIFTLAGKMQEIGCRNSMLVTIATEIHSDMVKIAKSFNIKIIDSILEKEDKKIIEEMKLK